jgi:hypothetical protein
MKKQKKTFTSIIITTITILIITNILLGAYDFVWHGLNRRKATQWYWYGYAYCPEFNTGYKTCLYNIRELQGAVEIYNMDDKEMMHELNLERLVETGCIKNIPTNRHYNCKYISKGDLTENGEVCCDFHGSFSEIGKNFEKEKNEFDKKNTIYNVSIRLIPAVLYFLYALISFAI